MGEGGEEGACPSPGSSTEDDLPGTLPIGQVSWKRKLLGQQENLIVPDYLIGPFFPSPVKLDRTG